MKNGLKICLIGGIIFCLLGTGLITAGAMQGGMTQLTDKFGAVYGSGAERTTAEYAGALPEEPGYEDVVEYSEEESAADFAETEDSSVTADKVEPQYSFNSINELELELDRGTLLLMEDDSLSGNTLQLEWQEGGRDYGAVKEGSRLTVKRNNPSSSAVSGSGAVMSENLLVIYVPSGYRFRDFELECHRGSAQIDYLNADQASFEVIEGEVAVTEGWIGDLDVENNSGAFICDALVKAGASIENVRGETQICFANARAAYGYDIECQNGIVLLGDTEYGPGIGGHHTEYHSGHHGDASVELECHEGNITVEFAE